MMSNAPFVANPYANVYTKEGLLAVVEGLRVPRPEKMTMQALTALSAEQKAQYDEGRKDWHANLGPYKLSSLTELNEELWIAFDKNRQRPDKLKPAFAVVGNAGVAKTTSLVQLAARVHRERVALKGPLTAQGHQRLPVCLITLGGDTGMLELNTAGLEFYGVEPTERSSAATRLRLWKKCVELCETELILIDDFHFIQPATKRGTAVSNHIKKTATELKATMGFGAVKIHGGLLTEGQGVGAEARLLAQTGRRTSVFDLLPLPKPMSRDHTRACRGECPTCQWDILIKSFEHDLVLADAYPKMLFDLRLSLWDMTQGYLLSLATAIDELAYRAVHTGRERIDREDLGKVKLDDSARAAYAKATGQEDAVRPGAAA